MRDYGTDSDDILAPRELLRGALNICRAIEMADRAGEDRVADECAAMLLQHLHMAKVVLVHDDLMLAGNIEMAAREVLSEVRETGHAAHYLHPVGAVAAQHKRTSRISAGRRAAGRHNGQHARSVRNRRSGSDARTHAARAPRAV